MGRAPGSRSTSSSHPGQEPSGPLPVRAVVIAETVEEFSLLDARPGSHQYEGNGSGREQKPVRRGQRVAEDQEQGGIVERVPNPAVRAARDQGVCLPRDDRVRQVHPQRAKGPDEQHAAHRGDSHPHPAEPRGQRYRGPLHPGGLDEKRDQAQHHGHAQGAKGEEEEEPFLHPVEWLAGRLGSNPVVDHHRQEQERSQCERDPEREVLAHVSSQWSLCSTRCTTGARRTPAVTMKTIPA